MIWSCNIVNYTGNLQVTFAVHNMHLKCPTNKIWALFHFLLRMEKRSASCWKSACSCTVFNPKNRYWWREGAWCLRGEQKTADCVGATKVWTPEISRTWLSFCVPEGTFWDFPVLWVKLSSLISMWILLLPSTRSRTMFTENRVPLRTHPISSRDTNFNSSQIQTKSNDKTKPTTYTRERQKGKLSFTQQRLSEGTNYMEKCDNILTPVQ